MISNVYYWLKKKDEDLAFGLAGGLVAGLAAGLAGGLFGHEYGLAILPVLICWFVLAEIVYIIQARLIEKKRYDSIWKVLLKKGEALLDVGLVGFNVLNIIWLCRKVTVDWHKAACIVGNIMLVMIGLALAGVLVYGFLKLNQSVANAGKKVQKK